MKLERWGWSSVAVNLTLAASHTLPRVREAKGYGLVRTLQEGVAAET
jgi:hypothetical protein